MDQNGALLREMRVCRFCLTDEEPLSNIYERDNNKNSLPLPLQVMACVALEVFANDGMPQLICDDCRLQTRLSYSFKTMCKKSEDALKLFLATGVLNKPKKDDILLVSVCNTRELQSGQKRPADPDPSDAKRLKKPALKNKACATEPNVTEICTQTEKPEMVCETVCQTSYETPPQPEETSDDKCTSVTQVQTHCYPCTECERSFPLQQLLEIHTRTHTRERKFECGECLKRFFTKTDLTKHQATHSDSKPFECVVCGKKFSRQTLLFRHEKVHVTVPRYLCPHCDKTYLSSADLDAHLLNHQKRRPYKCNQCSKTFAFKQGLERHEAVHRPDAPHQCHYCDARFNTPSKLTRHVSTHAGDRRYPCKYCPRTFVLSHHLTRHLRNHNVSGPCLPQRYKCTVCSMSFEKRELLVEHTAIHSMVNLKCFACGREFEDADSVREHISIHFTGLPFACHRCEYSFELREELDRHHETHKSDNSADEGGYSTDDSLQGGPRRSKRRPKAKKYTDFLTSELGSDTDEEEEEESADEPEVESPMFQPVVRGDAVRVYKGKDRNAKEETPAMAKTVTKITTLENLGLTKSSLDSLVEKSGFVEMKIGQKVIRVQKLMMTRSDVQAMVQQGKIEMKGSTVVVKNPSGETLDLNKLTQLSTPAEEGPSLLERKVCMDSDIDISVNKTPVRTYKKKPGKTPTTTHVEALPIIMDVGTEDIDLKMEETDLSVLMLHEDV